MGGVSMIQQLTFAERTMTEALRAEMARQPQALRERVRFVYAVAALGEKDSRFKMQRAALEDLWQQYRRGE